MALPLNRPSLRRKDFDLVLDAMVHDRLLAGETTDHFTRDLLKSWKLATGELLSSVNESVRRTLLSFRLEPGSKVLLSALAPQYWYEGLSRLGYQSVVADVEESAPVLGVSARRILDEVEVSAAILDCTLGYLPDEAFFEGLSVPTILDLSQGLGGEWSGRPAAHRGDFVFSAFGIETLLAGAGGSFWGARRSVPDDAAQNSPWEDLPDLTASLISSQWKDLDDLVTKKRNNFQTLVAKVPEPYRVPEAFSGTSSVHPWLAVMLESGAREVMAYARKRSVDVDWAFPGRMETQDTTPVPHARYFQAHTLRFPLYATMSGSELDHLSKVLASLP